MAIDCISCGQTNPDDATFCGDCGAPLVAEPPCAQCGRPNPAGLKFCRGCGTRLATSGTSQPAPFLVPPPLTTLAAGRYHILRPLGEGSKKRVYLARDTLLEREVAVAVFKTTGLDDAGRAQVQREARALGQLSDHPHIVTIYDVGEEYGQPYFVSQYLPGGSLAELLQSTAYHRLSLDRTMTVADQLCLALMHAHRHGILHRDLKPSNVWLTHDGSVKLGDFGLAASLDRSRFTLEGVLIGSAAYLPPEQLQGHPLDARSDLYSLGVILYEMVTGRPPFVGDNLVSVIAQHLNAIPVAPSWHNPEVPPALEMLILRLLAKTPAERPEDATAVREVLLAVGTAARAIVAPVQREKSNALDRLAGEVFVGRERQMDELRGSLEDALRGQGGVVMLMGEPGIGKTRTAMELTTYARLRGVMVFVGRCHEGEGAPPFWPWVQVARTYIAQSEGATLKAEMGTGAVDIAQVMGEVHDRLPGLPSPPTLEVEQARFRFFDSFTTFLKNVAKKRPLVVLLDDLQWADTPSLLLLQFLAREVGASPLLLIGTCRDLEPESQHLLAQTLTALARVPRSQTLLLRGLTAPDVTRFIELTTGQPPTEAVVAAVYKETEGNPFFVTEVVRLLTSEHGQSALRTPQATIDIVVPQSVRSVITHRLERLSEDCRLALTIASVIGREFSLNVLEAVGASLSPALTHDRVLELIEEAVAARLIVPVPHGLGQYSFSHALVRETLYEEVSPLQRIRFHRHVGGALEKMYDISPEVQPPANAGQLLAELAYHFSQAAPGGDVEKAVRYSKHAGERAMRALAYEEAVDYYERAFQLLELKEPDEPLRCDLLLALGEAQHRAGNSPKAREIFLQATELAKVLPAPQQLARAALGFGGELLIPGEVDEVLVGLLEESLAALGEEESLLRARVLGRLAMELYQSPSLTRSMSLSAQAVVLARRLGDIPTLAYVLSTRRYAMWSPDTLEERLAVTDEMVCLGEETGSKEMALLGHHWRVVDLLEKGDLPGMEAAMAAHTRLAEELRQRFHLWYSAVHRAMRTLLKGQLQEAEQLIEQALTIGQQARLPVAMSLGGLQLLLLRREQGRLGEMEAPLRQFADRAPAFAITRYMLAYFYSELEREAEARQVFATLPVNQLADAPKNLNWLISLAHSAEVCAFLHDSDSAAILYTLLLPYADRNLVVGRATICYGSIMHFLGILATELKRWEEAERHFTEALRRHEYMEARCLTTYTRYRYALMLQARRQKHDEDQAQSLLTETLATARELGMKGLEKKIEFQVSSLKSQVLSSDNLIHEAEARASSFLTPNSELGTPNSQPQASLFRCEGDYWTVAHQGVVFRLRDTSGVQYLVRLLQNPHQEFHVLDLVSTGTESEASTGKAGRQIGELAQLGLQTSGLSDAGEILDPQARIAYKRRLEELREELDDAQERAEPDRVDQIQQEIDFLSRELSGAVGLGGRSRKAASAAERARVNATRAIKAVIKKIAEHHPALEHHLSIAVKTGTFCSYMPEQHSPISWEF